MEKISIAVYNNNRRVELLSKLNSIEGNFYNYFNIKSTSNVLLLHDNDLYEFKNNKIEFEKFLLSSKPYKIFLLFGLAEPMLNRKILEWLISQKHLFNNQKIVVITANYSAYNVIDSDLIFMSEKSIICHWKPHLENTVNPLYNPKKFIENKKYKFISLTGKPKQHRATLVEALIDLDYLSDENFITYHPNSIPHTFLLHNNLKDKYYKHSKLIEESKTQFDKLSKMKSFACLSHSLYQNAYCNIYSEYSFKFDEIDYAITEKTFYPLLNNCLNVLWGNGEYYFDVLKNKFGFENYTEINDTSIPIYENLKNLKDINIVDYYYDNIKKIEYNANHAYYYFYEYNFTEELYLKIKEIL